MDVMNFVSESLFVVVKHVLFVCHMWIGIPKEQALVFGQIRMANNKREK